MQGWVALPLLLGLVLTAASCGGGSLVRKQFERHGMAYPLHVAALPPGPPRVAGPGIAPQAAPEHQAFFRSGYAALLAYPPQRAAREGCGDTEASSFTAPYLYRKPSGELRFAVQVHCYGRVDNPNRGVRREGVVVERNTALFAQTGGAWQLTEWLYGTAGVSAGPR